MSIAKSGQALLEEMEERDFLIIFEKALKEGKGYYVRDAIRYFELKLKGAKVVKVKSHGFGYRLIFDNGCAIGINPKTLEEL